MNCPHCQTENHNMASFCRSCGKALKVKDHDHPDRHLRSAILFFSALIVYIIIIHFSEWIIDYQAVLISDGLFALIVLLFFAYNFRHSAPLLKFHFRKKMLLLKILTISPLVALAVNYLGTYLNQSIFGISEVVYYDQFLDSPAPMLFTVVSISLFPAIFEEIAFRGILFNQLLNVMRVKPVIVITALLFSMLHLSLLSFLWIFPGSLVLGYMRVKHRSVVYGMITHFVYNTSIVLFQLYLP